MTSSAKGCKSLEKEWTGIWDYRSLFLPINDVALLATATMGKMLRPRHSAGGPQLPGGVGA